MAHLKNKCILLNQLKHFKDSGHLLIAQMRQVEQLEGFSTLAVTPWQNFRARTFSLDSTTKIFSLAQGLLTIAMQDTSLHPR